MSDQRHPESLSSPQIAARQFERLRKLLDEVSATNEFWKRRFESAGLSSETLGSIDSLDQLQKIPFTHKSDLVADQAANGPYGTNLTYPVSSFARLHQTSGTTTGQPMRWLDTPDSWQWFMDCWAQIWRIAGLQPEDVLCFPFSFGPFIGFWAGFEGANRLGNLCLAGGGMTSQARLKLIADNSATVVCCTPTYGLRLAEVAAEQNVNLTESSVRLLVVAGEPGGSIPAVRQRLETAWGARVIDHWGMTEIGALGIECVENPGGLHLLETECIVEIIDPVSGEPAKPNNNGGRDGELVITNLGRIGSPLIRYRTGDLVSTDSSVCPCGRSLVRLTGGILARSDDMVTIRGNNVFPSSVEAVIREFTEIAEFRIEVHTVRSMHHLVIQLEAEPNIKVEQYSGLIERLSSAIKDRLNFTAEIKMATDPLPRFELKGRRFVRVESRDA
jgi:phenylacetate-CoA ligase